MKQSKYSTTGATTAWSRWRGSKITNCDLCKHPIQGMFIDGKIKGRTAWCIMCPSCHRDHGVELGTGKGTLYQRERDAGTRKVIWAKVEGVGAIAERSKE